MKRTAFTLIELLVVIAIIAILAAILFPVFAQAREKARQTMCLSNTKQIASATMMYVQDYDETFPKAWPGFGLPAPYTDELKWYRLIDPYVKNGGDKADQGVFLCPSWQQSYYAQRSYGWNIGTYPGTNCPDGTTRLYCNGFGYYPGDRLPELTLSRISKPAETIFCGDISKYPTTATSGNELYVVWRNEDIAYTPNLHQGGANYCFADGHAKWLHQKAAHGNRDLFNALKP
jgi:prepilin-type N-terminal cleavage/methylation domain-containing protein/prepilin-type processing-associated H-X9-DG protein